MFTPVWILQTQSEKCVKSALNSFISYNSEYISPFVNISFLFPCKKKQSDRPMLFSANPSFCSTRLHTDGQSVNLLLTNA